MLILYKSWKMLQDFPDFSRNLSIQWMSACFLGWLVCFLYSSRRHFPSQPLILICLPYYSAFFHWRLCLALHLAPSICTQCLCAVSERRQNLLILVHHHYYSCWKRSCLTTCGCRWINLASRRDTDPAHIVVAWQFFRGFRRFTRSCGHSMLSCYHQV